MGNINITINGKTYSGTKNETILEVANRNGIEIPTLCNDPRLDPYSSCFVCVVEIEGVNGLQPACSSKIGDNMVINTDNERVFKARQTALNLLLSNHYADCVAPCKETCPAGVDVQGYISYIEKGMYKEAVELIKETNPLPAICGRVCVRPCEVACRRNLLDEESPVGIDYLKRFASDEDLFSEDKFTPVVKPSTGKKVAIIGAGPAGLSSAFFLQKEGHQADIFEAAPNPGGWLRYGIPEYRLPNDILDKEVSRITDIGVNINYNQRLGDNLSYETLKKDYDSVIVTIGSQKGTLVGCQGDDAENVLPGIYFLKEMEVSGEKKDFKGKTVAVVGGGNTAMDCCRTSVRCGAEKTYVIYRRTEKEMPANPIEIHESKLEGVEYLFLTNPKEINKDENGKLKSVTCLKMELGEPDASGRRRPVPVEGSDFDLEVDYILAAIGQKTDINFIDDINKFADGELKANKWGDIDANSKTLQTGIPSVFAAGDGVTGPATLIEAIGQARIAARSCNQYLSNEEIEPEKKEFISRKDNFKKQTAADYANKFKTQEREEMPVLNPDDRNNFEEVELGYIGDYVAKHETSRCLECGCTALYTCDLKKYATEYEVTQDSYTGEFKEYNVDFRHPYIEIDNNKCILCSRCINTCKDIVGANALGLTQRGFDTYVTPSLGEKLTDTNCESCGMCISACPTGAISENFKFKPGPVKTEKAETICNYCSIGCTLSYNHKNQFVINVTGEKGLVNKQASICKKGKFGYQYLNDTTRITKPLLKIDGRFVETTFDNAYDIIAQKIKKTAADSNAFFAGARLTNEELYLIQKLARAGAKTNNVNSFHYLGRDSEYIDNFSNNVPFGELQKASRIYIIGSETNTDNPVLGFCINSAQKKNNIPVELVTTHDESSMKHKADNVLDITSYYHFIKALNYVILSNNLENKLFIDDNCEGFEEYKKNLLHEKIDGIATASGVELDIITEFAKSYNKEQNAIIVYSEKEISANACVELFNLSLITGKLGKTASGLLALKEKNNSQGLLDMGIFPELSTGGLNVANIEVRNKLKEYWNTEELTGNIEKNTIEDLENGKIENMFIFGEDPIGCAIDKDQIEKLFSKTKFTMVQDYFMTETAQNADLILPASLPVEIGGSFTNTSKIIQQFEKVFDSKIEKNSFEQLAGIMQELGRKEKSDRKEIIDEMISLLETKDDSKYMFMGTSYCNYTKLFTDGCDIIMKKFNDELKSNNL